MTSTQRPPRAGRAAGPFGPHPTAPILARLPLLPANGNVDGLIEEGVFLASRHLGQTRAVTDRSRQSMRAYELRARWRPTPHGEFAGVTLADIINGPARLHMGTRHQAHSSPSAAWLAATVAMLLDDAHGPSMLRRLTVTTDATAIRRAERWEIEAPPANGHDTIERCTIRATPATNLIMAVCADGADVDAVLDAVRSRWPQAPESTVLVTLTDMIRHGFLLTDVLGGADGRFFGKAAPSGCAFRNDPMDRLIGALPPAHPVREPLVDLRATLAAADAHTPGHPQRRRALVAARTQADRICRVERPLTVDVAVDARIAVPAKLIDDAVEAAGILWRIAPRHDPAAGFHRRFVERYGHHRYVPLLEAADPVTGIGPHTLPETEIAPDPGRIAVLNGLIARAYTQHVIEVDLDEATVTALAGQDTMPPPSIDVYVRLVADSERAAAQGRLRLIVVGCVPTAGSTLARFTSLLGHHHTDPDPGPVMVAELAVRSRSASAQSVAPTTGFATYRIPVGVAGTGEHDLRLRDLLLVSDGTHITVWSATLNRQILPVLYSRLAPALLPPVARLLHILGQAGTTPWHTWTWESAAGPFQPRLRHRGTILSPARWRLPPPLIDAARDGERWDSALDRWRTETIPAPPPTILTDDDDRQLPLTLDRGDDRQLLRRYVRRGLTKITEAPGGHGCIGAVANGAHGRHLIELVIPLIRIADPPAVGHHASLPVRACGQGLFHPGGPWLSLAIPTAAHLHDEVMLCLADLTADLAEFWDSWFWLRYHTTALGDHLRVRFHGRPDTLGSRLLPAIAAWAATMNQQHLAGRMVIECYEQETERYGGPQAIEHAEAIFDTDSRLALTLLPTDTDHRIITTAQIAATVARTVADANPAALTGRHLQPTARQTMNRLRPRIRAADTNGNDDKLGGTVLFSTLRTRLAAYRAVLPAHARARCASSLIHMHANRTLPSADDEPLIRALAADLLARR